MKWIISTDKSNDHSDLKYKDALDKNKSNYVIYNYKPFSNLNDIKQDLGEINDKVVCHGTIPFISKIERIIDYNPGAYCNFRMLECKNYYPILKSLMLNNDYYITTWKNLLENRFEGVRFIRPNSGKKIFNGTICDHDHLTQDVGLSIANIEDNTLVFVTSPKEINLEWRFFVGKSKIITSSLYHENGDLKIEMRYDREATYLAFLVSTLISPDPIFVVDICKTTSGDYKVLELNGFSCSGLYDCDANEIVKYTESLLKG